MCACVVVIFIAIAIINVRDILTLYVYTCIVYSLALRTREPTIFSDGDEEIIIIAKFISPVHIRKICIMGGGEAGQHPNRVKCYVNQENLDFTNIESVRVAEAFELGIDMDGTAELYPPVLQFTNVNTLVLYFPSNHGGGDVTGIKYIGLQGEHTHYRREPVDTMYEVLCNGQDICQPEDAVGGAHSIR
jgi:hypothetical protein